MLHVGVSRRVPKGDLGVDIRGLWTEPGRTWAEVSVENHSRWDLDHVEVDCEVVAASGLDLVRRRTRLEDGLPVHPGGVRAVTLEFGEVRPSVRSVTCEGVGIADARIYGN